MSILSKLFGRKKKGTPASMEAWTVAKITSADGGLGILRYRESKPQQWQTAPLSEEVSITWPHDGIMPDAATNAQMAEFEDAMESLSNDPEMSLVLVRTSGGSREWCYYCHDYEQFMQRLNACLAGKPHFPISIEHSHDPEWQYWSGFVDAQ